MIVYILVYGIRPLIIRPKPVGLADVVNWGLVLSFDGVLLYTLGFKSLLYLLLGTVFGGGLHPIAGHLIQEHYMFVTVRNVRYYVASIAMQHLMLLVTFRQQSGPAEDQTGNETLHALHATFRLSALIFCWANLLPKCG